MLVGKLVPVPYREFPVARLEIAAQAFRSHVERTGSRHNTALAMSGMRPKKCKREKQYDSRQTVTQISHRNSSLQSDASILRNARPGNNRNLLALLRFVHDFDRVHAGIVPAGHQCDIEFSLCVGFQAVAAPGYAASRAVSLFEDIEAAAQRDAVAQHVEH